MTGKIGEDTLESIRERTDIVSLVSSYVALKRSGVNNLGLCPFHNEKTPSFNVNEARQTFHCFGCGEGGDVFAFLMKMEGLTFPEAARRLAEQAGVEIVEEQADPQAEERRREKERLWRINAAARDFYQQVLLRNPEGEAGRQYLKERGYDREAARNFSLGYAPDGWEALSRHLADKGFDREEIHRLGLTRPSREGRGDYDLFRDRLIFPIFDLGGEVAAFGGRLLGEGRPKYLNSPESPVYQKGRQLYGLYRGREAMRKQGEALVVEGYFDVLALHRAGFENVVATCGTAMTEDHARLLKRYVRKVFFLFDQDKAGLQATWKGMEQVLPLGLSGMVVHLPAGEDPDSFLQKEGAGAFRECLDRARPVLEVFQEELLARAGEDFGERARSIEQVLKALLMLPGEIERNLYLQELAARTGIDPELLKGQLRDLASQGKRQGERRAPGRQPETSSAPPPAAHSPAARRAPAEPVNDGRQRRSQRLLIKLMTLDGATRQRVAEAGVERLFIDPDFTRLATSLLGADEAEYEKALEGDGLPDDLRTLGAEIVAMDPLMVGDNPERIFEDCLKVGERLTLRERLKELQSLIDKAERSGDHESLSHFQRELIATKKRLQ